MSSSFIRAPHAVGSPGPQTEAPNAALLIDFDNVTMGMRSDLSKELKNLLNSDIIKGKVTVQRAYADWRRYPQYIVPLSENSVDLIFAPAYGSSKKNATDIRMAIDGMELVFIRPEIGTFILLTGDSDFSSLVLKLKEYGKYVIGVGIQESSSDILVQNCDEYYSYTSIAGLRKTTDLESKAVDPWILVEQSVKKMVSRNDVMRSDRLKQVMLEIDPSFDEGNFGFSKFSKFLSEAASRDLVALRKLDNGQFEVRPHDDRGSDHGSRNRTGSQGAKGRSDGRSHSRASETQDHRKGRDKPAQKVHAADEEPDRSHGAAREPHGAEEKGKPAQSPSGSATTDGADLLQNAYALLKEALQSLSEGDGAAVRDSDLKRKMLQIQPSFDEGDLGFSKFSRFLRQAHDHEVVDLEKREEGTYQVSPRKSAAEPKSDASPTHREATQARTEPGGGGSGGGAEVSAEFRRSGTGEDSRLGRLGLRVRRGGVGGRKDPDGPPPLLEGQVVTAGPPAEQAPAAVQEAETPPETDAAPHASTSRTPRGRRGRGRGRDSKGDPRADSKVSGGPETPGDVPSGAGTAPTDAIDAGALGLPTDGSALIRYLTNSYKGVGKKTAERLVEEFGVEGLYSVLYSAPDRISAVVPSNRAEQLLKGWRADLARRRGKSGEESGASREKTQDKPAQSGGRRTRAGSRNRRRTPEGG